MKRAWGLTEFTLVWKRMIVTRVPEQIEILTDVSFMGSNKYCKTIPEGQ